MPKFSQLSVVTPQSTDLVAGLRGTGDVMLPASGISLVAAYTPPFTGGVATTVAGKLAQTVSAFDFMTAAQIADAQAGTALLDCAAAFQSAFNSGASAVFIPPYKYRLASGVQFNGISVYSTGFQPTNPPSGCRLVFDLSVATCITMGGSGASNQSATLKALSILRAAGSAPAGSIGLLNQNTYATIIEDVASMGHQIPFNLKNNQNTLGFTCYANRLYTGAAYDSHVVIDSWPEAHFTNCRFGMNGSGDQTCNSYVRIQGGSTSNSGDGPNTIRFAQCQFNQGVNTGTNWVSFQNVLGGSLVLPNVIQFVNCYVEDDVVGIATDATVTNLTYLQITNLVFIPALVTRQFFGLNAATKLVDCEIANSAIQAAITLTGATNAINFLSLSNTSIGGLVILTGGNSSSGNLTGNFYKAGLTLAGAWADLNVIGGNIVGGSLSNSATGSVKVDVSPNNALLTWTPTISFGGASVGITYSLQAGGYQVFGNKVFCVFQLTLTSKGSSTGFTAIGGLPFSPNGGAFGGGGGGMVNYTINMGALPTSPIMLSMGGGTTVNLYQQAATTVNTVTDGNFTNTSQVHGTIEYFL